MTEQNYSAPLDKLFTFGDPRKTWHWHEGNPDYVTMLGLTAEHAPALIEIAWGWMEIKEWPEDDVSVYAPVHAWRALAQLRAVEAIELLLDMMVEMDQRGDDWHLQEFPYALALIGPAALPAIVARLNDPASEEYVQVCLADSLEHLAEAHPELREQVVQHLAEKLARFEENSPTVNGFLVSYLLDLKATEAAETMERAYAAGAVDESICGGWEEVRTELGVEGMGLAPDERQTKPCWANWGPPLSNQGPPVSNSGPRARIDKDRKREERKRQRKARKQNRRR